MSSPEGVEGIVLLEKPGCHLCEQVEDELRAGNAGAAGFDVVNIEESGELHDEYWLRIPVVLVGGVVVFEARMMDLAGEWRQTLRLMLGPSRWRPGAESADSKL